MAIVRRRPNKQTSTEYYVVDGSGGPFQTSTIKLPLEKKKRKPAGHVFFGEFFRHRTTAPGRTYYVTINRRGWIRHIPILMDFLARLLETPVLTALRCPGNRSDSML